jgi:PPP family 3-phenylpropionic acid transporter
MTEPQATIAAPHGFALRLSLFYGATFAVVGTHLPFFPVWLGAIGIEPSWIGLIVAVPSVTRFTVLPLITATVERLGAIRGAIRMLTFSTAAGFIALATQNAPATLLAAFVVTACFWTPTVPLTDAYALRAVARYGLDYGPLRLWGSAAFVVGALACGALMQHLDPRHLIWVIAAMASLGALSGLLLAPTAPMPASRGIRPRATYLLRDRGFLAIICAAALIQASHSAQYTVGSLAWQRQGIGGVAIAALWNIGVLAEIVVFALSPRIRLNPATQVALAGLCAVLRWAITAQAPSLPVLAAVQVMHGITFGLTMVATMGLLVRYVPGPIMASAQGYLAAATGIAMASSAIVSGPLFGAYGEAVYWLMATLAAGGASVIWLGRARAGQPAQHQPQSAASGG